MIGIITRKDKDKALRKAFSKIKEELEDHLDTINENTNELQSNYEFLCELENKMDKLNERMEHIQLFLMKYKELEVEEEKSFGEVQELSAEEKQLFVVLYTSDGMQTYKELAAQLGFSEELTRQYVTNLIEKGIPIIKEYADKKPHIRLNPQFRELQAKENIINLDVTLKMP